MRRTLLIVPFIFALNSCSSNVSSGFTVLLTGLWIGQLLAQTNQPPPFSGDVTLNLVQNDDGTLEGTAIIADPETNCWSGGSIAEPAANANASVSSAVTGNRVTFIINDLTGGTITIDGTATNNTITAIYTTTSTAGTCTPHSGTFNASRT